MNVHENHPYGSCYIKDRLAYVNIPKNASTQTKNQFLSNGFEFSYFVEHNNDVSYIVLLRDPLERWFSGLFEYLKRRHNYDDIRLNDKFIKKLNKKLIYDEHTEHQHYFIRGLPLERTKFFLCDNSLEYKLNQYTKLNFTYKTNPNTLQNFMKDGVPRYIENSFSKTKVVKWLKNNHERVKEFYLEDYKLIKEVI